MEKILTRINFVLFTFIGSRMLNLLLFIIVDAGNKFDKNRFEMKAVMKNR